MLYNDYKFPSVLCKGNVVKDFNENNIKETLLRETSINIKEAGKIALEVKREIFLSGIELITPPLLRELTNSVNIKLCTKLNGTTKERFEKARLEHTRIGIPYYDLTQLIKKYPVRLKNVITGHYEKNRKLMEIIFNLVIEEFYAVNKLIKEKDEKINENNR